MSNEKSAAAGLLRGVAAGYAFCNSGVVSEWSLSVFKEYVKALGQYTSRNEFVLAICEAEDDLEDLIAGGLGVRYSRTVIDEKMHGSLVLVGCDEAATALITCGVLNVPLVRVVLIQFRPSMPNVPLSRDMAKKDRDAVLKRLQERSNLFESFFEMSPSAGHRGLVGTSALDARCVSVAKAPPPPLVGVLPTWAVKRFALVSIA